MIFPSDLPSPPIHSFIHSFINYLIGVYYMLEIGVAAWEITMSKTKSWLSRCFHSRGKRQTINKGIINFLLFNLYQM